MEVKSGFPFAKVQVPFIYRLVRLEVSLFFRSLIISVMNFKLLLSFCLKERIAEELVSLVNERLLKLKPVERAFLLCLSLSKLSVLVLALVVFALCFCILVFFIGFISVFCLRLIIILGG